MNPLHKHCCPICECDIAEKVTVENGYDIVQCLRCDLVYVWPRPDRTQIDAYYRSHYASDGYDAVNTEWEQLTLRRFARYSRLLTKRKPSGKVLDVGCDYGFFLETMRANGFEVHGLDLNIKAVEYCRKNRNLDVRLGTTEDNLFPSSYFDIVTLWMVLEHTIEPKREMQRVKQMLKPGGIVCVQVPNISKVRLGLLTFVKQQERLQPQLERYRISTPDGLIGPHMLKTLDPLHHLQGFNVRSLETLLYSLDFRSVRFYGSYTDRAGRLNGIRRCMFAPLHLLAAINRNWLLLPSVTVVAELGSS